MASVADWNEQQDRVIMETLEGSISGKQQTWKMIGDKLGKHPQECLLRYKTVLSNVREGDATQNNGVALGLEWEGAGPHGSPDSAAEDSDPLMALHRRLFSSPLSWQNWPTGQGRASQPATMGYGEVGLQSVGQILDAVESFAGGGGTFYDLGSGRGHAVLAVAALPQGTRLFRRCVGIELHEPLHQIALQERTRWEAGTEELGVSGPEVDFVQGDIRTHPWLNATIVLAVSTLFEPDLIAALAEKADTMPPGTVFVTVSHPLKAKTFSIQEVLQLEFSWTENRKSYVFIQQKGEGPNTK